MMAVSYKYHPHIMQLQAKNEAIYLQKFENDEYDFKEPLVILNPYLITPLTALIMFRLQVPAAVHICVKGKTVAGDLHFDFPVAKEHNIPVYGLYANYANQIVLTLSDGTANCIGIQTESAPKSIHMPAYVQTESAYFGDQMMFVSPSSFSKMVAFDYAGELRWYTTLDIVFDIKRVKNGHLWIATERLLALPYVTTGIYEMSMLGKIYYEYRLPGGTHHDYVEDQEGNIIILTQNFNRDTVEDMCVVLERQSGEIIKTIDLKSLLPATAAAGNRANGRDWLHNNALWYDAPSNSLSFSGRNLDAIINLDYDTQEINWILGDPNKWPQEYVDRYFFTPESGQQEFEWFYAQHACMILPDGDIFLLDNGAWRSKFADLDIPVADKYTRGVRYRMNKETKTVRQIWQYGKERGSAFFSPHISNVDYYGPAHYMIHSGDIGQIAGVPCEKPPIFYLNKPEEKDLVYYSITTEVKDDQVVYEMKIPANAYYRAKKMSLYCPEDVLVFGRGIQLGSLDVTPTVRLTPPKDALPLPASYQAGISDEIDRFRFSILLKVGNYANLILKNETQQYVYPIATVEKDELAMCVGAFLSKEANETFIIVSKKSLAGSFNVYVMIEQQLYDLQLKMDF